MRSKTWNAAPNCYFERTQAVKSNHKGKKAGAGHLPFIYMFYQVCYDVEVA